MYDLTVTLTVELEESWRLPFMQRAHSTATILSVGKQMRLLFNRLRLVTICMLGNKLTFAQSGLLGSINIEWFGSRSEPRLC